MTQTVALFSVVVRDYDEALKFYVETLGFTLIEDTYIPAQDKRWVVVAPSGPSAGPRVLLARASNAEQATRVGNQTGGRVFAFLHTDDFRRDYQRYLERGVSFVRGPIEESFGTVAVFRDLYGNLWDLVEPRGAGVRPAIPPGGLPTYRVLTGPDDAAFCRRVSEALATGYLLHGSPAATFNGQQVILAQAIVWPSIRGSTG